MANRALVLSIRQALQNWSVSTLRGLSPQQELGKQFHRDNAPGIDELKSKWDALVEGCRDIQSQMEHLPLEDAQMLRAHMLATIPPALTHARPSVKLGSRWVDLRKVITTPEHLLHQMFIETGVREIPAINVKRIAGWMGIGIDVTSDNTPYLDIDGGVAIVHLPVDTHELDARFLIAEGIAKVMASCGGRQTLNVPQTRFVVTPELNFAFGLLMSPMEVARARRVYGPTNTSKHAWYFGVHEHTIKNRAWLLGYRT